MRTCHMRAHGGLGLHPARQPHCRPRGKASSQKLRSFARHSDAQQQRGQYDYHQQQQEEQCHQHLQERQQLQPRRAADTAVGSRRAVLAGLGCGAVAFGTLAQSGTALALPFLSSRGARGVLAEEEEKLYNLRKEKEGEARQQLQMARSEFEEQVRVDLSQGNKLCATPFGVDIVGITEFICLIGALVGGITARQRKNELERLNEQLRKINMSLRQQARSGTVYAPGLTYAPALRKSDPPDEGAAAAALPAGLAATATLAPPASASMPDSATVSMEDDELSPDQVHCREALKAGKRLLKENNGSAALVRFEKALMLSRAAGDKIQERRAYRGLAAAARIQGQYRSAIKHLEKVLEISVEIRQFTGDADAYGVIADCYTDLGEFERAATYYDRYIERMNKDGPV